MAGRILPVALAAIVGVSIGVATFDREFQDQRRKRLQEEYDKEVAAAAALSGEAPPTAMPSAKSELVRAQQQAKQTEVAASTPSTTTASSWSSMLGFWAWKKDTPPQTPTRKDATGAQSKP